MKFVEKPEKADIILLGLAVDQGTENRGCTEAPAKIRESLDNFYFSESAAEKNVFDASDVVEKNNFDDTMSAIELKVSHLLKNKKPIVSIGGNHSVTLPVISAFSKSYKKLGVLFIDAHPDCQKNYLPHGDVVSGIVKLGIPVVIIGIRNWSKDEYDFLKKNKIPFLQTKEFTLEKAEALVKKYLAGCEIYISLDIDSIDPAFAPATGCVEPMGLMPRDVLDLVLSIKNPVGFDLVEFAPKRDLNNLTGNLSAKIILEFIDAMS